MRDEAEHAPRAHEELLYRRRGEQVHADRERRGKREQRPNESGSRALDPGGPSDELGSGA
jgi:hypothetical protein